MKIKEGFYRTRSGMKAEVLRVLENPQFSGDSIIGILFREKPTSSTWTIEGKLISNEEHEEDLIEPWADKINTNFEALCLKVESGRLSLVISNSVFCEDLAGKRFKVIMEEV